MGLERFPQHMPAEIASQINTLSSLEDISFLLYGQKIIQSVNVKHSMSGK